MSSNGSTLYAGNGTLVDVIATASDSITGSMTGGTGFANVVLSPDGQHLYAGDYVTAQVKAFSTATSNLETTISGNIPDFMVILPNGTKGYLTATTSGQVVSFN